VVWCAGGRQDPGTHENWEPIAPEPLHIDTTVTGTETVMAIAGQFDMSSADLFGVSVGTVLEKRPRSMTIDARGLTFVDSSGLRSLLLARDAAIAAGVPFRVSEPSPVLRNLAERTGLRPLLLDD
jgi:anti-sigma B factor antagonist